MKHGCELEENVKHSSTSTESGADVGDLLWKFITGLPEQGVEESLTKLVSHTISSPSARDAIVKQMAQMRMSLDSLLTVMSSLSEAARCTTEMMNSLGTAMEELKKKEQKAKSKKR